MTTELLFVYGTLRRGQGNHGLLRDARFVSETRLYGNFCMWDLGAFPALVRASAPAHIVGETYAVDEATLRATDRLEGHPYLYERFRLKLVDQSVAWVYLFAKEHAQTWRIIDGGDWLGRSGEALCRLK